MANIAVARIKREFKEVVKSEEVITVPPLCLILYVADFGCACRCTSVSTAWLPYTWSSCADLPTA